MTSATPDIPLMLNKFGVTIVTGWLIMSAEGASEVTDVLVEISEIEVCIVQPREKKNKNENTKIFSIA